MIAAGATQAGSSVVALDAAEGVYLAAYLRPFRRWLGREDVSEIIVNRPGEVWVESAEAMHLERFDAPDVDDLLVRRLAEQVASGPIVKRETPSRVDPNADPLAYLRRAVAERRTILVSGGTSSGKTTFLNALLREVPPTERIILIEDTPEIRLGSSASLGLVAVKGELGEARVTADDLLQASLRMRPDRIVLGELRGTEAVSFLRPINTGHPGSFSTIHANSPLGALDQLALMVMQAGLGLSRSDTLSYATSVIDVIVQLDRLRGSRAVAEILDLRAEAEA